MPARTVHAEAAIQNVIPATANTATLVKNANALWYVAAVAKKVTIVLPLST